MRAWRYILLHILKKVLRGKGIFLIYNRSRPTFSSINIFILWCLCFCDASVFIHKWYLCLHSCGQSITLCKHWIRSMTWQYINLHNSLSIAFFSTKYMLSRESLIIKCYNQHIYVICEALNFYPTTRINATLNNKFLTWKWHF